MKAACLLLFVVGFLSISKAQAQVAVTPKDTTQMSRDSVEEEPGRDEFVDLSEEPTPIVPIQNLIKYPERAIRDSLEGKVIVQALIGKDGHVRKVEIVQFDDSLFVESAREAMLQAVFTPGISNGKPASVWVTRTISFRLYPYRRD
jgi:TonB family protein